MLSIILRLLGKKEWQIRGFKTEQEYNWAYDTRVHRRANDIKHFYVGYAVIVKCPYDSKIGTLFNENYRKFHSTLDEWMKDNDIRHYRTDIHRTWNNNGNDEFNEIGGTDQMYAAFTNEKDAAWFSLNWL